MGILSICTPGQWEQNLVLDAPGGFAWWYCDLVNAEGDGVVLIAFFGLPFLPGYQAERALPKDHPGINFVVYRQGKPAFYLLQEYEDATLTCRPHAWHWTLGHSSLDLTWEDGRVALRGRLDLAVPGSTARCMAKVAVEGPESRVVPEQGDARHLWCPIAPTAEGRFEIDPGDGAPFTLEGRAYIDANSSRVPLPDLGVAAWQWGHLAFPTREVVYYAMTPAGEGPGEPLVLSIPKGQHDWRDALMPIGWLDQRRNLYGLDWSERIALCDPNGHRIDVRVTHLVEEGPFYLRFLLDAECVETGEKGRGIAELVDVLRIDREWQRPFVAMRRHHTAQENSMWLPLFSGPREGRARRLLRHWFQGDRVSTVTT